MTKMSMTRILLAFAVLTANLLPLGGLWADDAKKSAVRVPDPTKVLKKVAKTVLQSTGRDGFQLEATIQGGTSVTADHAIAKLSFMNRYLADIAHGYMKVEAPDAFRTSKGTAMRKRGEMEWRSALATKEGAILHHFLEFPHVLLKNMQKRPENVQWIWIGDELPETKEEENDTEEAEGHTVVVKRKEKEDYKKAMPYAMRVDLGKKIAGDQWNSIVKSRIFDHGAG